MLLDTSILIDGRFNAFCKSGFLDAPVVVPRFVIEELHRLADSSDRIKRERGRRGLDNLQRLQEAREISMTIEEANSPEGMVDQELIAFAQKEQLRLVSTDSNLVRVAEIRKVPTLNLHDLASVMQGQVAPGDTMTLEILRGGETKGQGISYLPDGTMVVVEDGGSFIGQTLEVTVSNMLQTSAGRMVFAKAQPPSSET